MRIIRGLDNRSAEIIISYRKTNPESTKNWAHNRGIPRQNESPKRIPYHSRGIFVAREREELLVYLAAFIDICMQINLRRFYRGMTQVFLHHAEIL